jgi:hypothetical protein
VFYLSAVFFPLAFGSVALGMAQVVARMSIQRRWRAWLTNAVVSRWLTNGRYYQLNLVGGDHQNRNIASPRICGLPPIRRWISPPGLPRHSCPRRHSSWCFGRSAAP